MRKTPLLGLLLVLAWPASAQQNITLETCLARLEQHLPTGRQTALIQQANQAAIRQLRTGYLPQATLNATATWQTEVTSVPISLPGIEIASLSRDQYRATLDVNQVIWDGGLTNGSIQVQQAQSATEQQRVRTELYAAREQVITLYCAALLAQKQADILVANRADLLSRQTRLQEQVNNGTAIPASVQLVQARLLELDQQQTDLEARRRACIEALNLLCGLSIHQQDVLTAPVVRSAASTAIQRPELTLISLQQRSLEAQESLIDARKRPRISAIATLGYARPGLNFLSNEFSPYGIFGMTARWNLQQFYTGTPGLERQQLRVQNERLAAQRDQFLLLTEVKSIQQTRETDRLRQVLAQDQQLIALREQIAKTYEVQLDNGVITPSEYLTEVTQVTTARLSAALHEIQLIQAGLLQNWITGQE
jgi:outer membrane protein TolC